MRLVHNVNDLTFVKRFVFLCVCLYYPAVRWCAYKKQVCMNVHSKNLFIKIVERKQKAKRIVRWERESHAESRERNLMYRKWFDGLLIYTECVDTIERATDNWENIAQLET